MHFIKSILVTLSSMLFCGALYASGFVAEKADSLYRHMSTTQRLNQLVLVSTSQATLPTVSGDFGGIYFSEPLKTSLGKRNQLIVVQLDERLNPFTEELVNLPGLYTLAALSRADLLNTYLYHLEAASKSRGIDMLILPEVNHPGTTVDLVLQKMKAHDPDFFRDKKSLSFTSARKKKELIRVFEENDFWVIPEADTQTVSSRLEKYSDKIASTVSLEDKIRHNILARLLSPAMSPTDQIPNQLAVAISKASIIPLQRVAGIFPIQSDTISFVTNQPYGPMANMLRKYAYVKTAYGEILTSHSPIVLDNNSFIPPGILSGDRDIIFVGEIENLRDHAEMLDAALVYSHPSEIYSYVIPQQLFGASDITGRLPYAVEKLSTFNNDEVAGKKILGYAPAEMTGLDRSALFKIEQIMADAISSGSTPGGQLAIAVDGAIVLDQAYGFLTYDSLIPAEKTTLYDLASVTKVTGTLLGIMKLYEDGRLDLDARIDEYLPAYQNSNKGHITARALLAHNAGLKPYVPFWQKVLSADMLETFFYEDEAALLADRRSYHTRPNTIVQDTLKNWIIQSPLIQYDSIPFYSYSDIGFMILHQVVEQISGQPLDQYLSETFYQPMGLRRLTFNPLDHGFQRFEIAPTEHDYYFREELVWGEVHDRNAAVFGGIAGHAGLFATSHDLVVILQTLLQGGTYGDHQFLQASTIQYFNQCFFPNNRRALGWDKKDDKVGNVSAFTTSESFGHTGFTGTMIWADPQYNLIFVFLSNRIHPNSNNYKLIQKNIRTKIQDVVYEALMAKWIK